MPTEADYRLVITTEEAKVAAGTKAPDLVKKLLRQLQGEAVGDPGVPITRRGDLDEEFERAIRDLDPREIPVERLTYDQLIDELKSQRINVVEFKYGTAGEVGRKRDLVNEFMKRGDPLDAANPDHEVATMSNAERLRINAKRTLYLLGRMDAKLDSGRGEASVPRAAGEGSIRKNLDAYLPGVSRRHLLLASTYHPIWGDQVREMLDWLTTKPALRSGMVDFDSSIQYPHLTGATGRQTLERWLTSKFPSPPYHKEAREFASVLFTSLDMLTNVLQERQGRCDQTRYHNNDEKLTVDPIQANAPLHAWAYSAFRYGGNKRDYGGWVSIFYHTIPDGRFGFESAGAPGGSDATELRQLQELCLSYERIFYPVDAFAHKIPIPDFGKSVSPDSKSLVFLGSKASSTNIVEERLYVPGRGVVNKDNVVVSHSPSDENVADKYIDHETAFEAFAALLDLNYRQVRDDLTEDEIMSQVEGEKGGLMYKWLSIAGRAKAFDPGYLAPFIEPMLTRYCMTLVQMYKGDKKMRKDLVRKMQQALRETSSRSDKESLACYRTQINAVIANLDRDYVTDIGYAQRNKYIRIYVNKLYDYLGKKKPNWLEIQTGKTTSRDQDIINYLDYIHYRKFPPPPVSKHGSMIQKKS